MCFNPVGRYPNHPQVFVRSFHYPPRARYLDTRPRIMLPDIDLPDFYAGFALAAFQHFFTLRLTTILHSSNSEPKP